MMKIFENSAEYKPLVTNLECYWETGFDDLPEELKPLVERAFFVTPWDKLDTANRRNIAAQYDYQHDPNHEASMYYEITLYQEEIKEKIKIAHDEKNYTEEAILRGVDDRLEAILETDRERVGAEIQELKRKVSDNEKLENEVSQLQAKIAESKDSQSIPERSADRLNHDKVMQALANRIAAEYLNEYGEHPDKDGVARVIRKEIGTHLHNDSIVRRIRNTWKK